MYIGVYVKCPSLFSNNKKPSIFSICIFKNYSNIKLHENPDSGSSVVPCRWTDTTGGETHRQSVGRSDGRTGRQTDMAKLIVAFSNSVKASRNCKWKSIIKFRQVCTP